MSLENWIQFRNGLPGSFVAYQKRVDKYLKFCAAENINHIEPMSLNAYLIYLLPSVSTLPFSASNGVTFT